ncbi:MAG: hypothetical protein AAGP08_12590, partial [Pseudomonadota bacterium]
MELETVIEAAIAVRDGLCAGGVLPVIKHMPGHGRALVDSHLSLPVVEADKTTHDHRDAGLPLSHQGGAEPAR